MALASLGAGGGGAGLVGGVSCIGSSKKQH